MNNGKIHQIRQDVVLTKDTVEGLAPGVRYMFQVFAINSEGESDPAQEFYDVSKDASVLGLYFNTKKYDYNSGLLWMMVINKLKDIRAFNFLYLLLEIKVKNYWLKVKMC